MKDEETERGNAIHSEELRSFIERVETLTADKKAIGDDIGAVMAEAKARGYTPKYIRAIIKLREIKPSEREHDEAMMDLYMAAMGMAKELPLFRRVEGLGADAAVRESVIDALKLLAPTDGEITVKTASGPRVRLWRDKDGTVHVEDVPDLPSAGAPRAEAPAGEPRKPAADVPDVTFEGAHELGRQARRDDVPIVRNPFPWDDKRRRAWDEGWRAEDGGDGMGPK